MDSRVVKMWPPQCHNNNGDGIVLYVHVRHRYMHGGGNRYKDLHIWNITVPTGCVYIYSNWYVLIETAAH